MADALHTPGVTSAVEARLDDAGLITPAGPGALDTRTGVLAAAGWDVLVTGTPDTAPMAVLVAAHHAVTSRQASEGVYRGTLEVATRVPIDAAPASGSRIDVVWVKQNDASAGILTPDATTEWLVSKTTGTAATAPTKPPIPVGALELATVTVAAGATATNGAGVTIANTVRASVARGGILPVRAGDTGPGTYGGQYRDRPGVGLERWNSGAAVWERYGAPFMGPFRLPLAGGWYQWKDAGKGSFSRLQVYSVGNLAFLSGMIGNTSAYSAAATIVAAGGVPAGLRPSVNTELLFATVNGSQVHRADVNPDGSIIVRPAAAIGVDSHHNFMAPYPISNDT